VDAAGGTTPPPTGASEVEPNNTIAAAQAAREGDTIAGTLSATSDVDVFKVAIKAGSTLGAKLTPDAAANFDVAILNASGTTLASSTNTGLGVLDATSYKNNGAVTTTYYVRVKYTGGSAGAYQLVID